MDAPYCFLFFCWENVFNDANADKNNNENEKCAHNVNSCWIRLCSGKFEINCEQNSPDEDEAEVIRGYVAQGFYGVVRFFFHGRSPCYVPPFRIRISVILCHPFFRSELNIAHYTAI